MFTFTLPTDYMDYKKSNTENQYETDSCTDVETDSSTDSDCEKINENRMSNRKRVSFGGSNVCKIRALTDRADKSEIWYSNIDLAIIRRQQVGLVTGKNKQIPTDAESLCVRGLEPYTAAGRDQLKDAHQRYHLDTFRGKKVPNFVTKMVEKNSLATQEKAKKGGIRR